MDPNQQKEVALARRRRRRNSATPTMGVRDLSTYCPTFSAGVPKQKEPTWVQPSGQTASPLQPLPPMQLPQPPSPNTNSPKGKQQPVVVHTQVYRRRRRSMPVMGGSAQTDPHYQGKESPVAIDPFFHEQYLLAKSGHFLTPEGREQVTRSRDIRRLQLNSQHGAPLTDSGLQSPSPKPSQALRDIQNVPQKPPGKTSEKLSEKYRVEQTLCLQSLPPIGAGRIRRSQSEQRTVTDVKSPTVDYTYSQERRNIRDSGLFATRNNRPSSQNPSPGARITAQQIAESQMAGRRNSDSLYFQPQGYGNGGRRRVRRPQDLPISPAEPQRATALRTEQPVSSSPDSLPDVQYQYQARNRRDSDSVKYVPGVRRRVRRISISDLQNVDLSLEDHPDAAVGLPPKTRSAQNAGSGSGIHPWRRGRTRHSSAQGYDSMASLDSLPSSSIANLNSQTGVSRSMDLQPSEVRTHPRSSPSPALPQQPTDPSAAQLEVKPRRNSDSQFFRRRRPRHRAMQLGENDDSASDTSTNDVRRNSDSQKYTPRVRPRRRMSEGQAYSPQAGISPAPRVRTRQPSALQPGHVRSREPGSNQSTSTPQSPVKNPPPKIIITDSDEVVESQEFRSRSGSGGRRTRHRGQRPDHHLPDDSNRGTSASASPATNIIETQEYYNRNTPKKKKVPTATLR